MKASILISTYNAEEWLHKVLIGFSAQTEQDFEIIIADDGSKPATKHLIDNCQQLFKNPIIHVWHEDHGFQKTLILNKAIIKSQTDYLIFTDGDCIPREDFVATHLKHQEKGYFLSGGYFKLPLSLSQNITPSDILSQNCFRFSWLKKNGLKANFKVLKLTPFTPIAQFMNWITPTKRSWNGHNASGWKQDIIEVNGFNNDMQYGGEDRELGERMFNNGLLSKQIRYSAICVHLEHERGYASLEIWKKNNDIRTFNKKHNITFITNGIDTIIKNETNEI